MELEDPGGGDVDGDDGVFQDPLNPFDDYFDSACSTPFISAPSSPGRGSGAGGVPVASAFFFSAPSSPMHYVFTSSSAFSIPGSAAEPSSFEFEFSARFPASAAAAAAGSMSSADELFLNGQIRPMKLSSHLQQPQNLSPLIDLDVDDYYDTGVRAGEAVGEIGGGLGRDLKLRSRSIHRRARSHSPLRNVPFFWRYDDGELKEVTCKNDAEDPESKQQLETETPPVSASSSRSSSTSSSSSSSSFHKKRWIFLKDLLPRSRSEGSGKTKEKFWHHLSFAAPKERSKHPTSSSPSIPPSPSSDPATENSSVAYAKSKRMETANPSGTPTIQRPAAGRRRRSAPSPHERHYTANRAQAEELRRKTFLPYRQGLFGCLGISSRSYGAINGFARSLHSVTSR